MKSNSFVVLAIFYRNSLHSIRPHCPLTFKEAIQQSATQMCELHIFFSLPTSQFNFTSSTSFNSIVHMFPCLTWCLCGLSFPWSSMKYCIVQWREREFRATLASSGFVVYFAVSSMPWQSRFHGSDHIPLSIWLVGLFLL